MLKTLSKSLLIIAGCLFLISCASTGNQNLAKMDNSQANNILIDGKTTQRDVTVALGDPNDVDFNEQGQEKWVYRYTKSKATAISFVPYANLFMSGSHDAKKTIVIVFDHNKVVKRHTFVESKGETKSGILA